MSDFFDKRSRGYDEQMQRSVVSFDAFYQAIAQAIPHTAEPFQILDIGCGTGLELGPIFNRVPNAQITGIDLLGNMLDQLRSKHADRLEQIRLVQDSSLEVPFGEAHFDFAVSVMTLHHLLPDRKACLYARIRKALKPGRRYIEGDYMVSQGKEIQLLVVYREKLGSLGAFAEGAYHVDIPFSIETQRELLLRAGYCQVGVIWKEAEAAVLVEEA